MTMKFEDGWATATRAKHFFCGKNILEVEDTWGGDGVER